MADVIKAKIREILSRVPNVSNGQDMDTGSVAMETDVIVADGSKVPEVEEGDLVELKNLIKAAPSSDLKGIMEDQEMSLLLKVVTENVVKTRDSAATREGEEGDSAGAREGEEGDSAAAREVMEIFGSILDGLPPAYLSKELLPEMIQGLSSSSELMNQIWLKSLERVITNQNALEDVMKKMITNQTQNQDAQETQNQKTQNQDAQETGSVSIVIPVMKLLSSESVSNAKMCGNILVSMCKSGFLDKVMDERSVGEMERLISVSDIVKTRVLSLTVQVASIDEKCLKKVSGFLPVILHDSFNPSDPLLCLNCLQLLTQLSSTSHGIDFLSAGSPVSQTGSSMSQTGSSMSQTGSSTNQTGSPGCPLDKAANLIVNSDFPLADLLLPGYLTLFASVGSSRPSLLLKYGSTMEKILSHFEGRIPPNTPIVATCFDVLGSIGTSGEGKVVLNQCPGMKNFLTTIGSVITGPSGDLKLSALRSLSLLLTMDGSDLNGHEVSLIIETWFSQLSSIPGSVTKALFTMAQEPFLDHRLGSLEVIRVLSLHQFGQKELAGLSAVPSGGQSSTNGQQRATNSLPGGHVSFIEYLINRSTEFSKEGKEAKFAIVSELIISPFTISVFGRENYMKLKRYFKEGPFFVSTDSEPQVASRND